MINNPPSLNQSLSTVSIIQECDKLPVYSQQQLKFFDPSFFSHVNKFKEFSCHQYFKISKKRSCIKNCIYMDKPKTANQKGKHLSYLQVFFC